MDAFINWMDLKRQCNAYETELFSAIKQVVNQTAFSGGSFVDVFEKAFAQYLGTTAASGVNSGTSALFLALRALGIGTGDEVIVPANTFIATAWAVTYTGARPVFADCTMDTWELDPENLEQHITSKTKAIIGVHLYGQPFDFDAVQKIAERYDIAVIEDCAQAHGALYKGKKTGTLGKMGCFSFYPGKNLGSFGEAGAVVSANETYIRRIEKLKNHGSTVRYLHDEVGYNMRMEGIQGAVLTVKLRYLDQWNMRRREIAKMYLEEINNPLIRKQVQPEYAQSVFHLFVVTVGDRQRFMDFLKYNQIGCGLHYPVPCHLQKAYADLEYHLGDLPNAEYLAAHCCSLPMYPELEDHEIKRVIRACNSYKG